MKIRGGQERDEIKLQMVAMIDIVFQLLVFFIMTFKITALEGDFLINMPMAANEEISTDPLDNVIQVYLQENEQHTLQGLQITYGDFNQPFTHAEGTSDAFAALQKYVREIVEKDMSPTERAELEVEFEADDKLAYGETIRAIEAVSARVDDQGVIIPLIENIKFKDSRK